MKLLIDANPLLLYVVGVTDRSLISRHKRLNKYTVEDYDLLLNKIKGFDAVVVLPSILAEVSNFSRQINEPAKTAISKSFCLLVGAVAEMSVSCASAVESLVFLCLGFTDASIFEASKENVHVLTADAALCHRLWSAGKAAENFWHLKETR